jgi:hypothetical protein
MTRRSSSLVIDPSHRGGVWNDHEFRREPRGAGRVVILAVWAAIWVLGVGLLVGLGVLVWWLSGLLLRVLP